jgi:NAD+ synthase (glutamine-hydrolysing)
VDLNIDTVVNAVIDIFTLITKFHLRFRVHGGTATENMALQNIQARLRMVMSYLFASMLPVVRSTGSGAAPLLVLGTANVDERCDLFFLLARWWCG